MATAVAVRPERPPQPETEIVLTLTPLEAQYVHSALNKVNPARNQFGMDSADPVYDALGDALRAAGREWDLNAAERASHA